MARGDCCPRPGGRCRAPAPVARAPPAVRCRPVAPAGERYSSERTCGPPVEAAVRGVVGTLPYHHHRERWSAAFWGGGRPWWKQASGWLLASDPFLCALRRTRVIVGRFSLALRRRGSGTKEAKSKRAKKWVQKEVLRENISAFYRFVAASTHCFLGLSP